MNGLSPNAFADEETLEASARFLQFVTSDEAQLLWLDVVGELPASRTLIEDPELASDEVYGPFIRAFNYAVAEVFVDEAGQRDAMVNAINQVVLQGVSPADAWLRRAADQALSTPRGNHSGSGPGRYAPVPEPCHGRTVAASDQARFPS